MDFPVFRNRDPLCGMCNGQYAAVQINVFPFQRADLSQTDSCIETEKNACAAGRILILPEIFLYFF